METISLTGRKKLEAQEEIYFKIAIRLMKSKPLLKNDVKRWGGASSNELQFLK